MICIDPSERSVGELIRRYLLGAGGVASDLPYLLGFIVGQERGLECGCGLNLQGSWGVGLCFMLLVSASRNAIQDRL